MMMGTAASAAFPGEQVKAGIEHLNRPKPAEECGQNVAETDIFSL